MFACNAGNLDIEQLSAQPSPQNPTSSKVAKIEEIPEEVFEEETIANIKIQGISLDWAPHTNLLPQDFIREKPSYPNVNFVNYVRREKCDPTPKFNKTNGKFNPESKVSIATELTRDSKPEETILPEKYQEFSSVFSEEVHLSSLLERKMTMTPSDHAKITDMSTATPSKMPTLFP